jgi:hypothetical protein
MLNQTEAPRTASVCAVFRTFRLFRGGAQNAQKRTASVRERPLILNTQGQAARPGSIPVGAASWLPPFCVVVVIFDPFRIKKPR